MSTLKESLAGFMALHPNEIDLSLDRMNRLLEALGRPQDKLPPVIHIAGTNGKGSTGAYIRALLSAIDKRVHVYTSPHLVNFNERIRLGVSGAFVSDTRLLKALDEVAKANNGEEITFFEATTATALHIFAQEPADYLILEVGLGGLYDATNVVAKPAACVITPISRDHENFLGSALSGIAKEKAGIIKHGVPVICAEQVEEVEAVIERQAARQAASLKIAQQHFSGHLEAGSLVFQDDYGLMDLNPPRLAGLHQLQNASLALATLREIGLLREPDDADIISKALKETKWPARLQPIFDGAIVDELPLRSELWLDGGHNPDAGRAISLFLADLQEKASRPTYMICGMLNTKDPQGYFTAFNGLVQKVICVPITTSSVGISPEKLCEYAQETGLEAIAVSSLESALQEIRGFSLDGAEAPRVLIGGSLYLAGEVLDKNGTPPR
ncbi:bifunctional folylpolyglutamate synthase/dihydrofolate synthase [Polycladidibacter stylochi]|uniref:bifunctional folylpolyglutamate synthase/dihydrofolate synthase n=1 Tax=Polycladidibacter stylochi TaxID=1807766 RepID=UPI0008306C08|nr:folylpolyglutamate synthase/dihydrofolate synthase family protein [Pseudovibrio stylochi]